MKLTPKNKKNLIGTKSNSNSFSPIKIGYDFTTLEKPYSMNEVTFSKVKSILKETREEFSKILQVVHQDFDLSNLKNDVMKLCELNKIGKDYPNFLIKNDLIIFPQFLDLGEGTLAAAGPCLIGDTTYRPYGGVLYINNKLDFDITNSKIYIKNILLHEITHILIFHPFFFQYLNLSKTEGSNSYITSKKVIEQARKHFNCSSLNKIPLENQGGEGSVGSHWESRYMLGDYMISTDYPDSAISDITLALFEDSGFYKVNYYSGGLFKFGKNKGCDFFNKKCIEKEKAIFNEFCDVNNEPKCSSSRTIKSSCFMVNYINNIEKEYQYFSNPNLGGYIPANYCPIPYESYSSNNYYPNHCKYGNKDSSNNYGETIGENSFCFISSLSTNKEINKYAVCYEIECDSSNKSIIVKLEDKNIIFPNEGGIINNPYGLKGSIECPKYSDICNSNDNIVCNDIYSCIDMMAKKDNFNYKVSYYDYEEIDDDFNEFDEYDEFIKSINKDGNYKCNINVMIIVFFIYLCL